MSDISKLRTVPMTEEEKEHLLVVYSTRLRFFAFVFGVFILFGLYQSFGAYKDDGGSPYDYEVFGYKLVGEELFMTMLVLVQGLIFYAFTRMFFKKVYCFKKDAVCGIKEVIQYTVIDKKFFPNTNQYYISFDNPAYMHHEVDADTYYSLTVGDSVPVYRGIYSKHVFQKDARFTLM